jgi:hypothetical protein
LFLLWQVLMERYAKRYEAEESFQEDYTQVRLVVEGRLGTVLDGSQWQLQSVAKLFAMCLRDDCWWIPDDRKEPIDNEDLFEFEPEYEITPPTGNEGATEIYRYYAAGIVISPA